MEDVKKKLKEIKSLKGNVTKEIKEVKELSLNAVEDWKTGLTALLDDLNNITDDIERIDLFLAKIDFIVDDARKASDLNEVAERLQKRLPAIDDAIEKFSFIDSIDDAIKDSNEIEVPFEEDDHSGSSMRIVIDEEEPESEEEEPLDEENEAKPEKQKKAKSKAKTTVAADDEEDDDFDDEPKSKINTNIKKFIKKMKDTVAELEE